MVTLPAARPRIISGEGVKASPGFCSSVKVRVTGPQPSRVCKG